MNQLTRNALATLPFAKVDVERIYALAATVATQRLCESHERLRAELAGSEILRANLERELEAAKAEIERLMRGV